MLDDGGEADLDLGNYERYLDVTLSKDNNITTGKIYRDVIEKEVRLVRSCRRAAFSYIVYHYSEGVTTLERQSKSSHTSRELFKTGLSELPGFRRMRLARKPTSALSK